MGVDCHPDTCTVQVTQGDCPGDLECVGRPHDVRTLELVTWCKRNLQKSDTIVLEASGNSFEMAGRLEDAGFTAYVLESARVTQYKDQRTDNDRIAALRVARCWVSGTAEIVWRPDGRTAALRALLSRYSVSEKDKTRKRNELSGFLNRHMIRPDKKRFGDERERASWMQQMDNGLEKQLLQSMLESYDEAAAKHAMHFKLICLEVLADERMLRCMRLQGIGVINAFALIAVIGDIRRFETPEKLCSYVGLAPHGHQSGNGKFTTWGIGHYGRRDLRRYMVEGAQSVLLKGNRKTELGQWAMKLFIGKGNRNVSVAAVARKMLCYVWRLLNGKEVTPDERLVTRTTKFASLLHPFSKAEIEAMGFVSKKAMLQHLVDKVLGGTAQEAGRNDAADGATDAEYCQGERIDAEDIPAYEEALREEASRIKARAKRRAMVKAQLGRLAASPIPTAQGEGCSPISLGTHSAALAAPRGGLAQPSPNPTCGKRGLHVLGRSRTKTQILTQKTEKISS